MNKIKNDFIKNFVIWNYITGIFLFPVGIGFSVAFIILFFTGNMTFGEALNFIFIPICMIILFIVIRIFLYSDKLRKKRYVNIVLTVYLIFDFLFSLIIFFILSYKDFFENFNGSEYDGSKTFKQVLYVLLTVMLILLSLVVVRFYRSTKDEQKYRIIKKLYNTYFFLIPLFVIAFFSTMNFHFYAVNGILENILLGFALYLDRSGAG